MRFENKVGFVTGAGTGIGRAIALRLAAEGAKVCVTDINQEWAHRTVEEVKKTGGSATAFKLDVTNPTEVDDVIANAWKAWSGGIDLLVNNAGVSTMNRLVDLTERDWDFNMDVNAKGVFLVTQAAVRRMLNVNASENRRIVNVASMAGKMPATFLTHYTASKFAVVGFTKAVALELAPNKINVNCVCPGYVQTSMQDRELVWEANLSGSTPEKVKEGYLRQVPLGRLATPEDVATAVAFLCSKDADYMTGQAINVTGGQVMF